MTSRSKFKMVGRGMLLGVAVSTLPLAGCTELDVKRLEIGVSAQEKRDYDKALASGDPALVSRYLRKYSHSEAIRPLLNGLSPSVLQRVSPAAVAAVDPQILASLPRHVRRQLGLGTTTVAYTPSESDGY